MKYDIKKRKGNEGTPPPLPREIFLWEGGFVKKVKNIFNKYIYEA